MSDLLEVKVPDIGDFKDIPIIEVLVKPGDSVKAEDPLVTLESDKATVEVPSPAAGIIKDVKVKLGDKVSQGSLVLTMEAGGAANARAPEAAPADAAPKPAAPTPQDVDKDFSTLRAAPKSEAMPPPAIPAAKAAAAPVTASHANEQSPSQPVHASPSVRRFARELGVDLSSVSGSGPKKRILREDVQAYVKTQLAGARAPSGGLAFNLAPMPQVDFAKFGPIQLKPLSRIQKLSGAALHRNWVSIPHVTQHDEADITELEAFRKSQAELAQKEGIRFTLLSFLMKAVVVGLRQHPNFNASLAPDGESLVLKQYFHVGVAVDTPLGLVVPVIRDVDKKGLLDLAKELGVLSARMREGHISPPDLQGGCFSISSLGGLGGTLFTPIINAPEVAILGVGQARMRPVWDGKDFAPRLMLPLSLSYDHRVIDGAQGARFIAYLSSVLSDIRRLVL